MFWHLQSNAPTLPRVGALPDGVLHVVAVEGDEEAEDGEEHDGVSGQHQAARSTGNLK